MNILYSVMILSMMLNYIGLLLQVSHTQRFTILHKYLVILVLSLSKVKNGDYSQVPYGTSHTKDSFVAVHNKLLYHPVQKIMCTNYNQSFNFSSCHSCNHNLWQLLSCCWLVGWLVHCTSNLGDSSAFKCLFNVFGIISNAQFVFICIMVIIVIITTANYCILS